MPELPEVEVICRGVRPHIEGCKILQFRASGKSLRTPFDEKSLKKQLTGRTVFLVKRRAKFLEFHLDDGSIMLLHLGMTGNLGFFPPEYQPAKHDHLFWLLDNELELRFNDTRRFGSIQYLSPEQAIIRENSVYAKTGPEPFSEVFSAEYLKMAARKKEIPVKVFLMTNEVVAGIGNIYANESLFNARIRPTRKAKSIRLYEWEKLVVEIRNVLHHAIECGGSTISDFINTNRQSGYLQIHFKVYGRKDKNCEICHTAIVKKQVGGRASYYCPKCQK